MVLNSFVVVNSFRLVFELVMMRYIDIIQWIYTDPTDTNII